MFHVKHRRAVSLSGAREKIRPVLRKNVSRETSAGSPGIAILQNNPMHQKIVLVFQWHDHDRILLRRASS